jgi:hypothetical protein
MRLMIERKRDKLIKRTIEDQIEVVLLFLPYNI